MNVTSNLEYGFALIAMLINHACGGKKPMSDYMPHYQEPVATPQDIFKILSRGK